MQQQKLLPLFIIFFIGCSDSKTNLKSVDDFTYKLGSIGAFGEMVNSGVKQLALSTTMTTSEMDTFIGEALKVAEQNDVLLYRENYLIVTDFLQ